MYTIIWRFTVKPDSVAAFEAHYCSTGSWVAIFRTAAGYIGTELLRDTAQPNVYMTLDHWQSEAHFAAFDPQNNAAYQALDRACESLTLREEKLGVLGA